MQTIEQLNNFKDEATRLIQGANARIKYTGQVVQIKRVSEHGISIVAFRTGGEYFMSNKFLEPVYVTH